MNSQTEAFLARLIHVLSEYFKNHLILKGGMQLRLLNSPRSTQDVDFVLISKESKKTLVKDVRKALAKDHDVDIVKETLNSRGIFLEVADRVSRAKALVEISVLPETFLPAEPLSTTVLASRYHLAAHVISVMAPAESFSHKIAACLERKVVRDLYDLSLFEGMCAFDVATLKARLSPISIGRQKPRNMSFQEAVSLLEHRLAAMSEETLKEELYPLLPPEQRQGILLIIKASVSRIIQKIKALSSIQ